MLSTSTVRQGTLPMANSSVRQGGIVKAHVIQQIDNLKTDIQNLLDKKNIISKDEIGDWSKLKNEKIKQLKVLTEKLKKINKDERLQIQRQNEITKVSKTIDNLEYASAKKKNNSVALDKAKREKELRNEAREQYTNFQKIEKTYLEYDSDKLPGNLFLHKDILKSYGLCPFIDIQFDEEDKNSIKNQSDDQTYEFSDDKTDGSAIDKVSCLTDGSAIDKVSVQQCTYNKRLKWLSGQSDSGKLYYSLYDDLVNRIKCNEMISSKIVLENTIYDFIKQNITESLINIYDGCINFIEEYVNCNIKTKRIKERYNLFINDLSVLYSETSIEFHSYLSIRYNIHIVVNILKRNTNVDDVTRLQGILIREKFDDLIKEYKIKVEEIERMNLFIKNTLRNINTDLYSFLTEKHTFVTKLSNTNVIKTNSVLQVGKYFKRWSVLTKQEQIERFESFAHFYVDKNLVNTLIIEKEERDKMVETLFDLLKTNFESKRMVYRDYVWNTTRGIIETVKILRYNKDTGFVLAFTKKMPSKDGQLVKQREQREQREQLSNVEIQSSDVSKCKSTKKVSSRTIITKDSEKIINEELLFFILERIQNGVETIDNEDKDVFCEKIKIKLKVKKLMLNDKEKICKKYDEIFEIVKNNKS
jgi:hypothetical protein